jgi:outer membrane protein insertion porin family
MRLSPVLVAFLATTATLASASSARGEVTSERSPENSPAQSPQLGATQPSLLVAANPTADPTVADSESSSVVGTLAALGDSAFEIATPAIAETTIHATPDAATPVAATNTVLAAVADSDSTLDSSADVAPPLETANAAERVVGPDGAIAALGFAEAVANLETASLSSSGLLLAQSEQDTPDRIQIQPGATPAIPSAPIPTTPPAAPTAPTTPPPADTTAPEPRVLVGEVRILGIEGNVAPDLAKIIEDKVYDAIRTEPGETTTRTLLQEDINAVFKTGYFSNVKAVPDDTPLGVRVTFEVTLNPVLQSVRIEGQKVLPPAEIDKAFKPLYGNILNLVDLQEGIKQINKWYQDNGYVLAQVIDAPQVSSDGVVTLQVAEGEVEAIQVRFINKEGSDKDTKGNPIRGRTRDFIITREFKLKPGEVFNRATVQQDLQRVFGLGIFEDVKLSLNPGQDPRKVVVVANVTEKNTGSVAAGAGVSSASGLFGTISYQQQNLGGNNQRLGAEFQAGERELLFDFNFTDPWIAGDPYRTSYTFNLFRRRTISLIFDGGDPEVRLPADGDGDRDRPRVRRTGGSLSFSRPMSKDVFRRAEWTASLGLQYQAISIRDSDGDLAPLDELGNNLSFSGSGKDDLFTVQLGAVRDRRNNPLRPTKGSLLRFGTEQSVPIGNGSIFMNRLRASYSFYRPTTLLRFSKECQPQRIIGTTEVKQPTVEACPQAFAFNIQGGTILGDLPPYEAFALGGSNSVRGYDEGELAAARSFLQASAEYRFPIFSIVSGALFVDAATSFGTQGVVRGNPGGVRNKPGSGFGYGVGVRIQSPLGPIRIDYGFNDEGDSRLHFGIGERF